ncbi:26622_t:CDS:2 [Racocetra persica]|uniref:26622_t:CDS:1 n=1 Tax=Racocetra persica TaxID=160502 RepID=A0ACA9PF26_9GLOM|nr:26622_t:CDS:2 [Racocetra persica]
MFLKNYKNAEKSKAHLNFYHTLKSIKDDSSCDSEIRDKAKELLDNKQVSRPQSSSLSPLVSTPSGTFPPSSSTENITSIIFTRNITPPSSSSPSPSQRWRKRMHEFLILFVMVELENKVEDMNRMFSKKDEEVNKIKKLRRLNEIVFNKLDEIDDAVAKVIYIGSEQDVKVPRESVYDAEMYRILHNWLAKVHNFEVTGQWHLEQVCDDEYHHLYCNLAITKNNSSKPVAILELLATASSINLNKHFEQVLKYAEKLFPLEKGIVHFSHEDDVVKNPYWPCEELQKKGLNVVHFWHDEDYTNVRMSSRFLDLSGNLKKNTFRSWCVFSSPSRYLILLS